MKASLYSWIIVGFVCLTACKTPYFPFDHYVRLHSSEVNTQHDIKQIYEGYYRLNVYEEDTIYARKRIKYYTTRPLKHSREKVIQSLYLYFIDDLRFVYSERKFDTLDIVKDIVGKKDRLGLYRVYSQDRVEGDVTHRDYFVELTFAHSKVKKDTLFPYALLNLKLSDNNDTLDFVSVDYPLIMHPGDTMVRSETTPFSPSVMDRDILRMEQSSQLHYSSSQMAFHARWDFIPSPVKMKINKKAYNEVLYQQLHSNSSAMIRTYYLDDTTIFKEQIHEDKTQSNLITW